MTARRRCPAAALLAAFLATALAERRWVRTRSHRARLALVDARRVEMRMMPARAA